MRMISLSLAFVGVISSVASVHAENRSRGNGAGVNLKSAQGANSSAAKDDALVGELKSVGSDTMRLLMGAWAQKFIEKHPKTKILVSGDGSNTAPPALLSEQAQLAPMSRSLSSAELEEFQKKFGYKPTSIMVAADALAIYVNKNNPVVCLTSEDLDNIFSSTRKNTGGKSINYWKDVIPTGEMSDKKINLYGRNTQSGTYEFFRKHVLYDGQFKPEVIEKASSEDVVEAVAADSSAIGYSGIGYVKDGVRPIPIASYYGQKCYEPSAENALTGKYPLARGLYIYTMIKQGEKLDNPRREFFEFILSPEGQEIVTSSGFYPLSSYLLEDEKTKLGLTLMERP